MVMGFFLEKRNYNGRKTTNVLSKKSSLNLNKKGPLKIQQMGFSLEKKNYNGKETKEVHSKRSLLNFMYNRKAQLKIQQMAFMLIAVTVFFVLVGMFFLMIKFSDIKEKSNLLREENAMLLASKIANSPEFSCGKSFEGSRINCVDADKVVALKNEIEKYKKESFWGKDTNIEIIKIYPNSDEKIQCTITNYPECNVINLLDKEISAEYSNFIILCRKDSSDGDLYNKCEVAKIMVEYIEK